MSGLIWKTFTEFDEYNDALRHADQHSIMQNRRRSNWAVGMVDVGDISIQYGKEGSGIICQGRTYPEGVTFFVPISNALFQIANGVALNDGSVVRFRPDSEFTLASTDQNEWCSLYCSFESLGVGLDASQLISTFTVLRGNNDSEKRMYELLIRFIEELKQHPELATLPNALASAGREIKKTVRQILSQDQDPIVKAIGRSEISRPLLIRKVTDLIDDAQCTPQRIGDLASEVGVSERTIRTAIKESFGVNPQNFLLTRKLHRLRRALRIASPVEKVTDIMARHGIWEFGRYAKRYYEHFGEKPYETLCRER